MPKLRAGFDLGGTKLSGTLLTPDGEILASHTVPAPSHGSWVGSTVVSLLSLLLSEAEAPKADVGFVGVGVPALVGKNGSLHGATHIAGLRGSSLISELRGAGTWKVRIDNDVNCAALAAIAAGQKSFILASIGTGLGGAIVRGGRLDRGANGFAGEIGHMIVAAGGEQCGCGKRGCLEAYASGSALARRIQRAFESGRLVELLDPKRPNQVPSPRSVVESWRELGAAREIIEEFTYYLAIGLSNLAEVLDCPKVLIGGGVSASFQHFGELLKDQFGAVMTPSRMRQDLPIEVIPHGPDAGAIGAAQL